MLAVRTWGAEAVGGPHCRLSLPQWVSVAGKTEGVVVRSCKAWWCSRLVRQGDDRQSLTPPSLEVWP